jgi:hypothetical protein
MIVNIEKLRREVLTAHFKVLSCVFLGRFRKIIKTLSQQSGHDYNSQYFSDTLTSTSWAHIVFCPIVLSSFEQNYST